MRLIDADELKKESVINKGDFNSVETIRKWIDSQQTIEVVPVLNSPYEVSPEVRAKWGASLVFEPTPVRHGEWIKDCKVAFHWECSECGAFISWNKEEYLLRSEDEPNYCPNCGAKMDGGEK